MNKYFDKNDMFDSNNRIYEGYFTESKKENYVWSGIMSLLLLVIQFLSKESFLQKAKMVLVALSLIGFIGIVGAMEAGSLNMGTGLLIGAILIAIEYLCLKGRHRA